MGNQLDSWSDDLNLLSGIKKLSHCLGVHTYTIHNWMPLPLQPGRCPLPEREKIGFLGALKEQVVLASRWRSVTCAGRANGLLVPMFVLGESS